MVEVAGDAAAADDAEWWDVTHGYLSHDQVLFFGGRSG